MAQAQTAAASKSTTTRAPRAASNKGGKGKQAEKVVQTPGNVTGPSGKNMPEVTAQAEQAPEVTQEQRQGERRQQQQSAIARFATQEMDTPAVHAQPAETEEAKKLREFTEKMAALAQEMGVQLPALGAAPQPQQQGGQQRGPRADRQQQNGVTRPGPNTLTGKVWEAADAISRDNKGEPATIAQVKEKLAGSVNDATTRTQYARWRSYNGIKGRIGAQGGQAAQQQQASPEGNDEGIEAAWGRRKDDIDRRAADERRNAEQAAQQ